MTGNKTKIMSIYAIYGAYDIFAVTVYSYSGVYDNITYQNDYVQEIIIVKKIGILKGF